MVHHGTSWYIPHFGERKRSWVQSPSWFFPPPPSRSWSPFSCLPSSKFCRSSMAPWKQNKMDGPSLKNNKKNNQKLRTCSWSLNSAEGLLIDRLKFFFFILAGDQKHGGPKAGPNGGLLQGFLLQEGTNKEIHLNVQFQTDGNGKKESKNIKRIPEVFQNHLPPIFIAFPKNLGGSSLVTAPRPGYPPTTCVAVRYPVEPSSLFWRGFCDSGLQFLLKITKVSLQPSHRNATETSQMQPYENPENHSLTIAQLVPCRKLALLIPKQTQLPYLMCFKCK